MGEDVEGWERGSGRIGERKWKDRREEVGTCEAAFM